MTERYDLTIIGAGPGGYVAALRAAQLGLKTACIDKRAVPGGTCLNVGCIPSKALLQSTELLAHLQKEGKEHGIHYEHLSFDFAAAMQRKNTIVKGLVDSVASLFQHHHVDFIEGTALFNSPTSIEIQGKEGKKTLESEYFIIATGSEPIALPNLPFDERQIVSSTGALNLPDIPKLLAVIGGGVIGVELASVYQRLGSEVIVIEMLDHICPAMDASIHQALLQSLKKQGIQFMLSSQVVTAVQQPNEVILTINQADQLSNLSADVVLVAVGRRPFTHNLGLDHIGIQVTKKGFIPVNESFQTIHPHIFAIGDVVEGTMLAHRASEEGIAVVDFIKSQPHSIDYMAIPNVIYTYPEAAAVGLTEQEAKEAQLDLTIGKSYFKGNPRARCSGETDGFVKVIGEAKSGRLIGLHILGPHASELIAEGMMAMQKKASLADLADAAQAHPTLSEAIKEAALSALKRPIHQ